MRPLPHDLLRSSLVFLLFATAGQAATLTPPTGDPTRGKVLFQQSCALCHAAALGIENEVITGQGPSLVGVVGRRAATGENFYYTPALANSGLVWTPAALEHFLTDPAAAAPGTTMPASILQASDRLDLIAYLSTLAMPAGAVHTTRSDALSQSDPGDWRHDAPGFKHFVPLSGLPPPYRTTSAGNGPHVIKPPASAGLSVPPGFTVRRFATGLTNPRLVRVAPNGDVFIAETAANRIRVLRAADGADAPAEMEIFAAGLDRPFGLAFYPSGADPQWIYIANNNAVVRIPYRNGDLRARGAAEVIVPALCETRGGHTTRDVVFSADGRRMFISIGSASNVAESMAKKTAAEVQTWETVHGRGAAWGPETNRADILVTDPEGRQPLRTFATGIRNGVGLAVDPATGELWTSTNERDGLGDDLVPDYITRVREGGFYGWPWYYLGKNEDPRHAGERPDLAGQAIVPDVLLQAHSASLQLAFYTATGGPAAFPAEYRGDIFASLHGSWNRNSRTGYKVVRVRLNHGVATGVYEDFLTGFVVDGRNVWGRPVGVAVAHDGALLVTEDGNGTVWRVAHVGH